MNQEITLFRRWSNIDPLSCILYSTYSTPPFILYPIQTRYFKYKTKTKIKKKTNWKYKIIKDIINFKKMILHYIIW